jgi:nicotinamide mononucleotide transporter
MGFIEFIAAFHVLVSAILAWCEKPSSFVMSGIGSLLYVLIFFNLQQPANMTINICFVLISIWGYTVWKTGSRDSLKITSFFDSHPHGLRKKRRRDADTAIMCLFAILGLALISYIMGGNLPDLSVASLYMISTIFLIRKYLESWLLFIATDLAYLPYLASHELWFTFGLTLILTTNAIYGFIQWKKLISTQSY